MVFMFSFIEATCHNKNIKKKKTWTESTAWTVSCSKSKLFIVHGRFRGTGRIASPVFLRESDTKASKPAGFGGGGGRERERERKK